jgi:hypothetical protein
MVMAKSNQVRVELASSATSLSTHKPAKKTPFLASPCSIRKLTIMKSNSNNEEA